MAFRRNKYNVSPKEDRTADGVVFDSKWECQAYGWLKKLIGLKNFELSPVYELQPSFKLGGKTIRAIKYIGDFLVKYNGKEYTIDTKGMETDVFKLKEKLFKFKFDKEIIKLKRVSQLVDFVEEIKNEKEI